MREASNQAPELPRVGKLTGQDPLTSIRCPRATDPWEEDPLVLGAGTRQDYRLIGAATALAESCCFGLIMGSPAGQMARGEWPGPGVSLVLDDVKEDPLT